LSNLAGRFGSPCAGRARDLTAGELTVNLSHQIPDVHGRQWSTHCSRLHRYLAVVRNSLSVRMAGGPELTATKSLTMVRWAADSRTSRTRQHQTDCQCRWNLMRPMPAGASATPTTAQAVSCAARQGASGLPPRERAAKRSCLASSTA